MNSRDCDHEHYSSCLRKDLFISSFRTSGLQHIFLDIFKKVCWDIKFKVQTEARMI